MSCVNSNRKLSDIDCRYYLAKDSIDHDFFDLDQLEKTVSDLYKESDANPDQISMIATCSSDNIICDEDNDIVVGRASFYRSTIDEDECLFEEVKTSRDLINCIAFAENPEVEKLSDYGDIEIQGTIISNASPTGAEDRSMDFPEEDASFPSITPIPFENSDLTEVTPCTLLSTQSTPNIQDEIYLQRYQEAAIQQSKMSLLVDALDALKLSQEFETRNNGLRRLGSRRRNLTFTNEELSKIERENKILLGKITAQSKPRPVQLNLPSRPRKTTSFVNRIRKQQEIERQNYILFKKIQAAKSRKYSVAKFHS